MSDVFARLVEAIDAEGRGALVSVIKAEGSTPRDVGARMVVRPSGGFHGTIGGGALEWDALARAGQALAEAQSRGFRETISLGPDRAQCCGGRVTLQFEIFAAAQRADLAALAHAERDGPLTLLAKPDVDGRYTRTPVDATCATSEGASLEIYGERRARVLLFGAGHVGRALVLALAPLPFTVRWIDTREAAFPAAVPANVTMVGTQDPAAELDAAPAHTSLLIMTHSHALDFDLTAKALASGRFSYVGLIGSETKRARFVSRLRAMGVAAEALERLVCPIGVAGIAGKAPAVIAASVAAQLLTLHP